MIGTRCPDAVAPDDLQAVAEELLAAGGRVRFAYAWSPADGEVEVRYVSSVPDQRDFEMWVVRGVRELPSLAAIFPSIGWYEREMMDLNGLRFTDHPEPYPLVLKDSGEELANAIPAATGRARLPDIDAVDVQQLPFGPIRADVVESAEFTFVYVGEHIIHYQPRLFFKHRGMETCFEGARSRCGRSSRPSACPRWDRSPTRSPIARRSSGRPDAPSPPRAKALRVLLAEMERIYNHLHYLGHLCHTTTLKVGEAQGKLLEERGEAAERPPDREPLPAKSCSFRAACAATSTPGNGSATRSRACGRNSRPMPGSSRTPRVISTA